MFLIISPLVSLDGNQITGFEALARWESKSLGHIAPDVFIALASVDRQCEGHMANNHPIVSDFDAEPRAARIE